MDLSCLTVGTIVIASLHANVIASESGPRQRLRKYEGRLTQIDEDLEIWRHRHMQKDWQAGPWKSVDESPLDMRPGPDSRVWHLGSKARSVTVWRQQDRALELIDYFASANARAGGGRKPFARVAVVGGGIAGLTAAAGAVTEGIHVTLFEKRNTFMGTLRRSNRHVAPRINDWPYDDWDREDSGTRVLPWRAQSIGRVVSDLKWAWDVICDRYKSSLDVRLQCGQLELDPPDGRRESIVVKQSGATLGPFDAVILAVGFAREHSPPWDAENTTSYWFNDRLDQDQEDPNGDVRPKRVLIFGTGDGALAELLRALLQDFGVDTMFDWARTLKAEHPQKHARLAQRLCAAEDHARGLSQVQACQYLNGEYGRIARDVELPPGWRIELDPNLYSRGPLRLRDPRSHVILCGMLPVPIDVRASILHRFITQRLWALKTFEYELSNQPIFANQKQYLLPAKLTYIKGNSWADAKYLRWDGDMEFDHVMYRTGAKRVLEADFSEYWQALR
jgi:pyridine nucleotide-disulfide oxidoreductase